MPKLYSHNQLVDDEFRNLYQPIERYIIDPERGARGPKGDNGADGVDGPDSTIELVELNIGLGAGQDTPYLTTASETSPPRTIKSFNKPMYVQRVSMTILEEFAWNGSPDLDKSCFRLFMSNVDPSTFQLSDTEWLIGNHFWTEYDGGWQARPVKRWQPYQYNSGGLNGGTYDFSPSGWPTSGDVNYWNDGNYLNNWIKWSWTNEEFYLYYNALIGGVQPPPDFGTVDLVCDWSNTYFSYGQVEVTDFTAGQMRIIIECVSIEDS